MFAESVHHCGMSESPPVSPAERGMCQSRGLEVEQGAPGVVEGQSQGDPELCSEPWGCQQSGTNGLTQAAAKAVAAEQSRIDGPAGWARPWWAGCVSQRSWVWVQVLLLQQGWFSRESPGA